MEFKADSFYTNVYRWYYGIKRIEDLPTDGCKYLLNYILAGFLIIPCSILVSPIILCELITKDKIGDMSMKARFGFMIFLCIGLFLITSLGYVISTIWIDYPAKTFGHEMSVAGGILIGFAIVIGAVIGITNLIDYIKDEMRDEYDYNGNKIRKSSRNMIIAYYKAKKEKNCPIITWKD